MWKAVIQITAYVLVFGAQAVLFRHIGVSWHSWEYWANAVLTTGLAFVCWNVGFSQACESYRESRRVS